MCLHAYFINLTLQLKRCWIFLCATLCRLASHINAYKCFQIELSRGYDYSSFQEDLKNLYDMAGVQNLNTVFLFTDTQVNLPSLISAIPWPLVETTGQSL